MRYLNARHTLLTLLHYGVLPIINENDTVSVAEIRFGDNDTLAAMVCNLVDADALIILTDIEGLYTADPRLDPHAQIISTVPKLDARIEALAGKTTHRTGRGGMYSKIQAAKVAGALGLHTYIASGLYPDILLRILAGEAIGTHIYPSHPLRLSSRKRWIGYALKPKGGLVVDDGARQALMAGGKSLLPSGILDIIGNFHFGDAVYCVDATTRRFAQGLVNYSTPELQAIMGKHTAQIAKILGHKEYDEVIHRDNLVLLETPLREGARMALTLAEKTRLCAEIADSRKAEAIVVLDIQPLSSVADNFLICSGFSNRQVKAIADAIEEQLIQHGEKPLAIEGYREG